jgi:hypothetical protein
MVFDDQVQFQGSAVAEPAAGGESPAEQRPVYTASYMNSIHSEYSLTPAQISGRTSLLERQLDDLKARFRRTNPPGWNSDLDYKEFRPRCHD